MKQCCSNAVSLLQASWSSSVALTFPGLSHGTAVRSRLQYIGEKHASKAWPGHEVYRRILGWETVQSSSEHRRARADLYSRLHRVHRASRHTIPFMKRPLDLHLPTLYGPLTNPVVTIL